MTRFWYINDNVNRIKEEVKLGIVSPCVIKHYEIYCRYDYYRKLGHSVRLSAQFAGADHRMEERSVFYIIKNMEQEI